MLREVVPSVPDVSWSTSPALKATGLRKAFGHVVALRDANLEVRLGEVTAIVGDNGAGKSTLMKVLSGVIYPDAGELELHGERVEWSSPKEARQGGVASVFQDLALVEPLSVAANMFLGLELKKGPFLRRREMVHQAASRLDSLGIRVPSVQAEVGRLSGGQRQGVAIARAVLQGGQIVIMDEPTAALGVRETRRVEEIIMGLRDQGRGIILVSHDLNLVFRLADRIHVLRLGTSVGTIPRAKAKYDDIVGLITGSLMERAQL